jgi:hypothetical protein
MSLQPAPGASSRSQRAAVWIVVALAAATVVTIVAAIVRTDSDERAQTVATPPPAEVNSASVRPVDGGPRYYARFPKSLPTDPSYFPIGVWFESVTSQADIDLDKQSGINLYMALTGNSNLPLLAANHMKVIAQPQDWVDDANAPGSEAIAGWLLGDEVDMQTGAVEGQAKMQSLTEAVPKDDGRLRYTNYGKGVVFWNADADAARYVNGFQDVVSADTYWFTDTDICGPSQGGMLLGTGGRVKRRDCQLAANYGRTVDRLRKLTRPAGSRPVWAFIEVGHPFSEGTWPSIEPAQVRAAVWSSIIHGARGIVYFNHSFGGSAPTQHALREPHYAAVRRVVTETNARIRRLAPVLNAPFVTGFATTSAAVDTMTKRVGHEFFVFADSAANRPQRAVFELPCAGKARVSVLDENRTLTMSSGSFADTFADGNAVHIYRIDGKSSCWLPAS